MKTITKIVILVLALLTVVPMLAACGNTNATTDGGVVKPPVTPGGDGPEVIDMDRYIYKAYVRGPENGNGAFACEDFWVDPSTGGADALSFAVIERNKKIETMYNCTIRQDLGTLESMYEEMRTFYENNTRYDLTIMVSVDAAASATAGFLSDLKTTNNSKYMDITDEAFDENFIEQMTLGNNLYYISGDMNISSLDNTIATIFNVNMYAERKESIAETLEDDMYLDLYQMVTDGQWTMDNLFKISQLVDLDGNPNDGLPRDADNGDTIGYYQYQASPLYYYYAAGLRITTNVDGYPEFDVDDSDAEDMYTYLYSKLNLQSNPHIPNGASGDRRRNFISGSTLFADFILWDVRKQLYPAKIDFAYGILPVPTYEENEEHHSVVYFQNCHHLWAIPYKRNNPEYAARMMHIMAYYSAEEDSTMDAYYVRTMYMEVARDDGSRASLDIIRTSMVYDIALLYCHNGLWGRFDKLFLDIDRATGSQYGTYTSNMDTAEAQLQETMDQFVAMSDEDLS